MPLQRLWVKEIGRKVLLECFWRLFSLELDCMDSWKHGLMKAGFHREDMMPLTVNWWKLIRVAQLASGRPLISSCRNHVRATRFSSLCTCTLFLEILIDNSDGFANWNVASSSEILLVNERKKRLSFIICPSSCFMKEGDVEVVSHVFGDPKTFPWNSPCYRNFPIVHMPAYQQNAI